MLVLVLQKLARSTFFPCVNILLCSEGSLFALLRLLQSEGKQRGFPGVQLGRCSAVHGGTGKPICLGHSGDYKEGLETNTQASLRKKEPFPKKWAGFIPIRKMMTS